jgi:hypothetical protein
MNTREQSQREQIRAEVEALPAEYLPFVAQMIRAFRETVAPKAAAASFRQGWIEARRDDTHPVSELWEDLDVG